MTIGVLAAFFNGFFSSVRSGFIKHHLVNTDSIIAAWISSVIALLITLPLLLIIEPLVMPTQFWTDVIVVSMMNALTAVFTVKALKKGDLSIIDPLRSLVPVFVLLCGPFILNEYPDMFGLLGVLSIIAGSYLLELRKTGLGILSPVKALWRHPGAPYMIVNTLLWGVSSTVSKRAIIGTSTTHYIIALSSFMALFLTIAALFRIRTTHLKVAHFSFSKQIAPLFIIGFLGAAIHYCQAIAMTYMLAVYVIAIKRLDLIFSIIIGKIFFRESSFGFRFAAGVLMITGTFIILFF